MSPRLLIAALLIAASSACMAAPRVSGVSTGPGPGQYTEVRAVVLTASRSTFPQARLNLQVLSSSNPKVLDIFGSTPVVTADAFFWRKNGKIDFQDSRNVGAIAAYYLLQGDEINAKLFVGSAESGKLAPMYIYGISRNRREPAPTKVVRSYTMLELSLETDKSVYQADEPVQMTLAVTNTSGEPQTLSFSSGQQSDFVVTQNGQVVWQASAGKMFTQALGSRTLAPNETIKFRATWEQRDNKRRKVAPGDYEVKGILTIRRAPRPYAGPVRITIE